VSKFEASPVRRAEVCAVPLCESLGEERGHRGRVHVIVLEPCLEVAEAGFNDGARLIAIAGELGNRIKIQVVEGTETVLSRWPGADVCPALIVSLEEREAEENASGREVREAADHSALARDSKVVSRRVESAQHPLYGVPRSVHDRPLSN